MATPGIVGLTGWLLIFSAAFGGLGLLSNGGEGGNLTMALGGEGGGSGYSSSTKFGSASTRLSPIFFFKAVDEEGGG